LSLLVFLKYLLNTAHSTPAITKKASILMDTLSPTAAVALNLGLEVGFEGEDDAEVVVGVVGSETVVSVLGGGEIGVESDTSDDSIGPSIILDADVSVVSYT
jgi:hypothetical protein